MDDPNVEAKNFPYKQDHRSRSHQYFHLIDLLHAQRVSYHARGSSVMSPRICCGLWSWQRSHLWSEDKASPRFCWVRDPTGGTVEEWRAWRTVCLTLWKWDVCQWDIQIFRTHWFQACFSISYELPITPLTPHPKFSSLDVCFWSDSVIDVDNPRVLISLFIVWSASQG